VRKRVGPSRLRWDRIARIALVLVLFGVMVSYLNPLVNLVGAWRTSKASEERLVQLKSENADLQRQLDEAESPLTLGREARKMGMVKPGERLYVIEGLD
jgi:cell division protein FtsB